jgi:acetyl coenzyme A synthetase (ADP forming)-like protein
MTSADLRSGRAEDHALLEVDAVLRDGSTAHIRRTNAGDEKALLEFYTNLSDRSRWLRFMSAWAQLDEFVEHSVDQSDGRVDLVATTGSAAKVIAHAMYVPSTPGRAEVAFAVDEAHQRFGVATLMLGRLAEIAHANGITAFEAVTLPENRDMIGVFRRSGFGGVIQFDSGQIDVEFPTALTPTALAEFDARARAASAAAVRTIVAPRSIAVIGASRREGSIGGAVLRNLVKAGYTGRLFPVNPRAATLEGLPCYPSVSAIPEPIDVAVIVVPSTLVLDVARDCAAHGVRGLIVISSGFAEVGPEGAARQAELMQICRAAGMRVVGPNCFGVVNTDPRVAMDATFGRVMPPPGHIGFLTQSGALGLSVIDKVSALGLGISTFISNGNKTDISGNDLLSYWETDDQTDLILLYLESFGNPRRFARIARHVGRSKPILAVKSGRSAAGARATTSHTGALLAASDVTVDALFKQSGVVRCDTLAELFDTASLFSRQPIPRGDRVVIVTNAGGLGILGADACEAAGLRVEELDDTTQSRLRRFLPAEASVTNPIDMIASASADDYVRVIEAVTASADAVVAIYIPPFVSAPSSIAAGLRSAAAKLAKRAPVVPLLSVFMSDDPAVASLREELPVYAYPEDAARALSRAVAYGQWLRRAPGEVHTFDDLDTDAASAVIAAALSRGASWLSPEDVAAILDAHRVPRVVERVAPTPSAAAHAAAEIGFPVALKAVARGVLHKSEAHGVQLGLDDEVAVQDAAQRMSEHIPDVRGFIVQTMAGTGVEMLVGVVHDPLFGPVVAVGAGGVEAELLRDVNVRLTPLTDADTAEMVSTLRTYPRLTGYRGSPAVNVSAFEDLVQRVGAMIEAHPEIAELDCNPVIVTPAGAIVVDARIRVEHTRAQTDVARAS